VTAPRKHHYVPAFYLKQWAGESGKLCQHRRLASGKVVPNRKHPDATGYKTNLYKIEGLPEELAHEVELQFMRLLDTGAHATLQTMLDGTFNRFATSASRSVWTQFLLSLKFRNPDAVALLKRHLRDVWNAGRAKLKENYHSVRAPTDPLTFESYVALSPPHEQHKIALDFLKMIIDNDHLGPMIFDLHWSVLRLDRSDISLLTSDRPLILPDGLQRHDSYIALPIGPKTLFVAGRGPAWANRLGSLSPTRVVKEMNYFVVAQAREFVWGTDDRQLPFIQKHIGELPDRPILTEEQTHWAINATAF